MSNPSSPAVFSVSFPCLVDCSFSPLREICTLEYLRPYHASVCAHVIVCEADRLEALRNQMRLGSYSPQEPLDDCTTWNLLARHTFIITKRLDCTWIGASLQRQKEREGQRNLFSVFHFILPFFLPLRMSTRKGLD